MVQEFIRGSGNVFADMAHPRPEEALAKAQLASRISAIIEERGLTQVEAAALLGTQQSKVSKLRTGQLAGFTIERLARYLNALDEDVEIVVRHASGPARFSVALV